MTTCCWQKQKYDVIFPDLLAENPRNSNTPNDHQNISYSLTNSEAQVFSSFLWMSSAIYRKK